MTREVREYLRREVSERRKVLAPYVRPSSAPGAAVEGTCPNCGGFLLVAYKWKPSRRRPGFIGPVTASWCPVARKFCKERCRKNYWDRNNKVRRVRHLAAA